MPFFFKCIDRLSEKYKGRELNLGMKKVLPKSIGQEFLHKQSEATHHTAVYRQWYIRKKTAQAAGSQHILGDKLTA